MTEFTAFLIEPFADGAFRRAFAAMLALSVSGAPLGVFLALRRMALMGDAMSHAILPGVALGFVISGMAWWPMALGGLIAGLAVTFLSGVTMRLTPLKEDACFTGVFLISLAAGVLILTMHGSSEELLHMLFGDALSLSDDALRFTLAADSVSLLILALIYRGLVAECADPLFLKSVKGGGALYHQIFLMLVALNLVAAFQAMGALMTIGLMILPAIAALLCTRSLEKALALAAGFALLAGAAGRRAAYHYGLPSGPCAVLAGGAVYVAAILLGPSGGIIARFLPQKHYAG